MGLVDVDIDVIYPLLTSNSAQVRYWWKNDSVMGQYISWIILSGLSRRVVWWLEKPFRRSCCSIFRF